jgi:hypothetical protein
VKYIDHEGYQLIRITTSPFWAKEPRILVLTDVAVYIMQILDHDKKNKISKKKPLPDIILRRRIALKNSDSSTGVLDTWNISTLADDLVWLSVKPISRIADPKAIGHPGWLPKENVKKCERTGKPFGFFQGKKRCKVTGKVMLKDVCDLTQCIPDHGYYEPNRVSDGYYGLTSCDQIEDIVIVSAKKTEFLGIILNEWEKLHGNRFLVKFISSNTFNLRQGPDPETSMLPAKSIVLRGNKNIQDSDGMSGALSDPNGHIREILTLQVSEGIPESVVESRRKRQIEKAKSAEINRKLADEQRKARNKHRDTEAEKKRLLRLQERKASNITRKVENKVSIHYIR